MMNIKCMNGKKIDEEIKWDQKTSFAAFRFL